MHKVDPMEIMLSDIFNKVFYSKEQEPRTKVCEECIGEGVIQRDEGDIDLTIVPCEECSGEGIVDVEVYRPHNFNRDVGVIDVKPMECETCGGTGRLEVEDE